MIAAKRWTTWLTLALLLCALVPLLLKVPAVASFTQAILTYPFQVDDSEGVILSEAQLLARGVDPYQPARPDFFTAAPYTPLYTLLNAVAFAVGPFTFKVGRVAALLATLLVAALVGLLIWRHSRQPLLTAWAVLAVLTTNLVSVWSVRARPDHLALACNLTGFALLWWHWPTLAQGQGRQAGRWQIAPNTWRLLWLTAICCALGFYCKQTLLAAPAALGLALLLVRPRLGFVFGGIYALLVLVPFALLTLLTRGGFYQHIVAFHSSWSWRDFWLLAEPFLARYWPLLLSGLLLLPGVLIAALRHWSALRASRELLAALYLLLALFFALGAGTHGGNHNHFVETIVVVILCLAVVVGWLYERQIRSVLALAGALLLLAISVGLGAEAQIASSNWLARDFRQPLPQEREGWANVAAYVTNDPGPVYSDNVGLLLVAGKEVRYTDPFSLAYATRTGQWDDRELVARVERGEFSLIALRYDIFALDAGSQRGNDLTPAIYTALRNRYRVVEKNVMILYAPR